MKGCEDVIQECWNHQVEGSRMFSFHDKLKHCRETSTVLHWRKKENANSKVQIECIKKRMSGMQKEGEEEIGRLGTVSNPNSKKHMWLKRSSGLEKQQLKGFERFFHRRIT